MQPEALTRALVLGAILAVLSIGLFFLLYYVVLANAEVSVRLFGSLLLPPVIMGVLLGGYAVFRSRKRKR